MKEIEEIQHNHRIVGRAEELSAALACVRLNRNLLIEGPVGVGKTVLALAVAQHLDRPFFRVDGDERYSEQKLTGWFDPPIVLAKGYDQSAFIPGPLTQAMLESGLLFVNELNRMPESVQNVLLPSLDERIIIVPKYGEITARDGFTVIATQNPREFVATSHLSEALRDRFELITLAYQPVDEEIEIVRLNLREGIEAGETIIRDAIEIIRATREAQQIRRGASVRAAISMVELATQLQEPDDLRRAAQIALPTRIELADDVHAPAREIIDNIVDSIKKKLPHRQIQEKAGSKISNPNLRSSLKRNSKAFRSSNSATPWAIPPMQPGKQLRDITILNRPSDTARPICRSSARPPFEPFWHAQKQ